MSSEQTAHPAVSEPAPLRREYLTAVTALSLADGNADDKEREVLSTLCRALDLTEADLEASMETARAAGVSMAEKLAVNFRENGLGTSLLVDAIAVTFADRRVDAGESAVIARLAHALDVNVGQVTLLARHVEVSLQDDSTPDLARVLGEGLASQDRAQTSILGWLFGRRKKS